MAKDILYPDPYNAIDKRGRDDDRPDSNGNDLYYGGNQEIERMQASETVDPVTSPNSDVSYRIHGGEAPGEPNPARGIKYESGR